MKNIKVLVACPTYDGMDYCLDKFLNAIKNLDFQTYDILIVDNSDTEEYYSKLLKIDGIKTIRETHKKLDNRQRIVNSRNLILKYAKENSYDYILMMDQDVIPPKEIIKKLLSSEKNLISGIYLNYFAPSGKLKILPVAWKSLTQEEFEEIKTKLKLPSFVGKNTDMRRHLTDEEVRSGRVIEVIIPSAGCLLISKKVFEQITYEILDLKKIGFQDPNVTTTDDIGFCMNALNGGFKIYCDTSIKCEHLVGGKYIRDSEGRLVHKGLVK